jgi:hypothetical protein
MGKPGSSYCSIYPGLFYRAEKECKVTNHPIQLVLYLKTIPLPNYLAFTAMPSLYVYLKKESSRWAGASETNYKPKL